MIGGLVPSGEESGWVVRRKYTPGPAAKMRARPRRVKLSAMQAGPTLAAGLSEEEAKRRLAERGPMEPPATSRSTTSIVRANVFTLFNAILLVFGIVTLAFGEAQDALFLLIVVANASIGSAQEIRAKRALDQLAALVVPIATVVRDGTAREVEVAEVVVGDLVRLQPGDQVVADGTLRAAESLALDESILTGEAEPVRRGSGDGVRSGSFVAEGAGAYDVTAVGDESYAERLSGEARQFRHPRSPLERALNRLLLALVAAMVPLALVLGAALWDRNESFHDAVPTVVAAVVTLVPEGLILLASLTYAVAALRMSRRGALAQQLNAIESLASVDVVCIDKTGTLTESALAVDALVPAAGLDDERLAGELGRYAASASVENATMLALRAAYPAEPEPAEGSIPFSSTWKWSGATVAGTAYALGAPELFDLGPLAVRAETEADSGRRVLAFGTTTADLGRIDPTRDPAPSIDLLGLVVIAERLRAEAAEIVAFFQAQGIELKVISGDRLETVAAVARDAGIAADGSALLDARSLPGDPEEFRRAVLGSAVIGRISPEDKRRVVETLRDAGRYVAMVGDGVNDVPALKASRLAVAQGSGSQMARSVADVVLVRGDFAAVPAMVGEGRRILRNLQRVTKLFVVKSAFAAFLILSVGLTPIAYPLLPRHLTLAALLTVGIPSFFLALAPSSGGYATTGFIRDVARFAFPAGTAAGLGVVSSYLFALNVLDLPLVEARTVATTVLVVVGLYLIFILEASGHLRSAAVTILCGSLAAVYGLVLAVPGSRSFFELAAPGPAVLLTAATGAALAVIGLWLTDDRFVPGGTAR